MARSTYIYVATHNGELVAAFTVKYELLFWAHSNRNLYTNLWRLSDGKRTKEPVDITKEIG